METLLSNCNSSSSNSSGNSSNALWNTYLSNEQFDLNENYFDKELGFPELFPIELSGSLHYDIKKIESSESSQSDISVTTTSDYEYDNYYNNKTDQIQIKNTDCMWSGLGSNSNNNNNNININTINNYNKINNNDTIDCQNTTKLSMQNIPPGQSLLINSRLNQQNNKKLQNQQQQQQNISTINYNNKLSIPSLMASDFIKDREQLTITNTRPDTPISLDDDPPEFKHSVDLAACIMGSNNISLNYGNNNINNGGLLTTTTTTNTDQMIINKLKEQLEDPNRENIDLHKIIPFVSKNTKKRSLTEVLNVIRSDDNDEYLNDSCDDNNNYGSDSEYDDDDDINGVLNNCNNSSSSSSCSSNISSCSSIFSSSSPPRQINNNNNNNNYLMMHSDHSYTRSKDGVEDCTVDVYGSILETPSDSDEEIDVVSVGDKKLPTNPSDKDRRALQTKVAHKISARIVKTANGIRTIPPRRRDSYEPYTNNTQIGTITPNNQNKSLGNSRYPTPAPTPYPIYNNNNNNVTPISIKNSTTNPNGNRKRNATQQASTTVTTTTTASSLRDEYLPSNKRYRGKKYQQQQQQQHKQKSLNHSTRKNVSDHEEAADTIEKRNLHNDMERQRRIGLKNLFEALKKQIPSIKDKERAPKVNILREAAKLCDQLNRDDKLISNQKQQLLNQLQRREALLISLKAAQCKKEIESF